MTRDELIEAMRSEICRHQCQGETTADCQASPNCLCLRDAQAGLRAIEAAGFHLSAGCLETEAWATWNDCNGIFDVYNTRAEAAKAKADIAPDNADELFMKVVPVRCYVEPADRHLLRHGYEDDREAAAA